MSSPRTDKARVRAKYYFDAVDDGDLVAAFSHWTSRITREQYEHFVWNTLLNWGQGAFGARSAVHENATDDRINLRQERFYQGLPFALVEELVFRREGGDEAVIVQWTPYPLPSPAQKERVLEEMGPAFYRAIRERDATALDALFPLADAGAGLGDRILGMASEGGELEEVLSLRFGGEPGQPNEIRLEARVRYTRKERDEELNFFLNLHNELHLQNWRPGD